MQKRNQSIFRLLLIGLVFHLVYIGTVFDCYFTSPVVHGMQPHKLEVAEAKRLVLIVADGLRADLLLELNAFASIPDAPEVIAPYLRSIIETRGAFGLSHTHVPTESRPGHVALIGGMYEDVSAVTRGWKTNPVDFDSVFNQSAHTFSFGSPDILPMFARGATPGKVDMWCYHEDEEDFTKDATALDVWVLAHLRALFHNATTDSRLDGTLRENQTIFFLHLLGLDTTGHSYRPHSREYMANIQVVDEIVRQTEQLFTEFYKDQETAFIFTADHGMSKIGNHGDGDPDNTRTPLVAWGKGIRGPLPDSTPPSHDAYSAPWKLTHLLRHDVEQADIAALMSALLGVNWPVNSVGVLPDVDSSRPGYLLSFDGEKTQAQASLVNAKVILEHYRMKHEIKKTHTLFYKPFPYFATTNGHNPGSEFVTEVQRKINMGAYTEARALSAQLIRSTLDGLRYLETYDRTLIRAIVTVAYLGWIAFGAVSIYLPQNNPESGHAEDQSSALDVIAAVVLAGFWSLFTLQRSPWTFYLYICFPTYFWHQTISRAWTPLLEYIKGGSMHISTARNILAQVCLIVGALESMVIGYTHRQIWSAGFVVIGIIWPLAFWSSELRSRHAVLLLPWALTCLSTAVFPLLSVDKEENLFTIIIGGLCMLVGGIAGALLFRERNQKQRAFRAIIACLLLVVSMLVTYSSASSLRARAGLPRINQVLGWVLFLTASVLPFFIRAHNMNPKNKILIFFMAFSVCFVLLSISVEGLFYCAFSATLLLWIEIEAAVRQVEHESSSKDLQAYKPRPDDLRIAVFFLFFVQVAFFGTGKSFYLEPVYRLVPVFNPFLMAVLLMFKVVSPYIILATCLHLLNVRLHLPPFSLFLVALTLTDVMTMTFFFNVTDTGSWLEIGQSISFFCISSLLLVWAAGTCAVGEILMTDTDSTTEQSRNKTD
ncbi:alkaline phosphatase-like protein [Laetiporus sulphureus 93-53]|uniref:GPI ethanolamine phosphate transferase 1 n=1 Tax=Laetiporus sulphureus 93-53 TaxID=1314785 RepID=A0A165B709_9APHY|nr:alkaline phosphatase-like protein [Laetiporus sulphureus 93-53]KZT00391.1 alkaline phosphatase-like protein [Laetiporus sulphureus 93-53]